MTDEDRWRALGVAIDEGAARHQRDGMAQLAQSLENHLICLFTSPEPLDASEDAARARTLEGVHAILPTITVGDWGRTSSPQVLKFEAEQVVWRNLHGSWELANSECEESPAEAWGRFVELLREDLELIRQRLVALLDATAGARRALETLEAFSHWPLVYVGHARKLHGETWDEISRRSNIPRETFDENAIIDHPCFILEDDARPLQELADVLEHRSAWAKALFELREHLRS